MAHDELDQLLGAYALDAVDPDERRRIEAYLAIDAGARDEVAQHREIATLLSYGGGAAPPGVWDRIVDALDLDAAAPPPGDELAKVLPLAAARRNRARTSIVAAIGLAAAVVIGVLGATVLERGRELSRLERSVSAGTTLERSFGAALNAPGARRADLLAASGGSRVEVVVGADGVGYLGGGSLPTLADDRTYQLWGVLDTAGGKQVISLGVLGNHPGVVSFAVGDSGRVVALVLTDERRGGVPTSQQPAALQGTLT
jgi:anti-sigma-K factor RskA